MTRIEWIDMLRGFSMMAILWFHTEVYYTDTIITPYAMYVGDVLAVFFFLSGYLMYSDKAFNVRHKLYRILRPSKSPAETREHRLDGHYSEHHKW